MFLLSTDAKYGKEKTPEDTMRLGQYANPELVNFSSYHKKLDAMMNCVAKNAAVAQPGMEELQDKVCAKEYRELRLEAFRGNLFYHHVNHISFTDTNQFTKGFSAF